MPLYRHAGELKISDRAINFDGSVALCCNVFDSEHNVAADVLSTSHTDLQALKDKNIAASRAAAIPV